MRHLGISWTRCEHVRRTSWWCASEAGIRREPTLPIAPSNITFMLDYTCLKQRMLVSATNRSSRLSKFDRAAWKSRDSYVANGVVLNCEEIRQLSLALYSHVCATITRKNSRTRQNAKRASCTCLETDIFAFVNCEPYRHQQFHGPIKPTES